MGKFNWFKVIAVEDLDDDAKITPLADANSVNQANYQIRTFFAKKRDEYNGLGLDTIQPTQNEADGTIVKVGLLPNGHQYSVIAVKKSVFDSWSD